MTRHGGGRGKGGTPLPAAAPAPSCGVLRSHGVDQDNAEEGAALLTALLRLAPAPSGGGSCGAGAPQRLGGAGNGGDLGPVAWHGRQSGVFCDAFLAGGWGGAVLVHIATKPLLLERCALSSVQALRTPAAPEYGLRPDSFLVPRAGPHAEPPFPLAQSPCHQDFVVRDGMALEPNGLRGGGGGMGRLGRRVIHLWGMPTPRPSQKHRMDHRRGAFGLVHRSFPCLSPKPQRVWPRPPTPSSMHCALRFVLCGSGQERCVVGC